MFRHFFCDLPCYALQIKYSTGVRLATSPTRFQVAGSSGIHADNDDMCGRIFLIRRRSEHNWLFTEASLSLTTRLSIELVLVSAATVSTIVISRAGNNKSNLHAEVKSRTARH